jgi:hypothetical protein
MTSGVIKDSLIIRTKPKYRHIWDVEKLVMQAKNMLVGVVSVKLYNKMLNLYYYI